MARDEDCGPEDGIYRRAAKVLAKLGEGGDDLIAHLTPGEVVIPRRLQTPAVLAAAARTAGVDVRRLRAGDRRNRLNPRTGAAAFDDSAEPEYDDLTATELPQEEGITITGPAIPAGGDVDQLARMIVSEDAEEYKNPQVLQALGAVARNRVEAGNDKLWGGHTYPPVLSNPNQFKDVGVMTTRRGAPSLWAQTGDLSGPGTTAGTRAAYAAALPIAEGIINKTLPDNTGGALNFFSGDKQPDFVTDKSTYVPIGKFKFVK